MDWTACALNGPNDVFEDAQVALFEERAENLSEVDFVSWTAPTPHESQILRLLMGVGPKLLSGPRGCGKTTLLRTAELRLSEKGKSLPVYVNYGRSMFIEPAFGKRSDADGFFQDWLVAKVIVGVQRGALLLDAECPVEPELFKQSKEFVDSAETRIGLDRPDLPGPSALAELLSSYAEKLGRTSTILLLDDAAHAFVPEQQRVFFEFLRNIRAPGVTFKAAIYPGVTEFSPNFNVGHDAKIIPAWISTGTNDYLPFMRAVLAQRLPHELRDRIPNDVVDLLAMCSFGIPRAFLSMIEAYLDSTSARSSLGARTSLTVISTQSEQMRSLYSGLSAKLPRYGGFVEAGTVVLDRTLFEIRSLNEERSARGSTESAVEIAVRQPIDERLNTVFGFLEYAGLIRRMNESVSLGKDGTYSKFAVHGALLTSSGAIKYGQNPSLAHRADALSRSVRTGRYKRVVVTALMDAELRSKCQLRLGACPKCGTERGSENARFCSNCGSQLVNTSRLDELLSSPIESLLLTDKKIEALKTAGFKTVESVVRDRGNLGIATAQGVGPIWSRRIRNLAEEYVGV